MQLKKSKRSIKFLVIHCTATPEGREHSVADIDRWHKQRGFTEIGYNYVIQLDGTIQTGRDVDKTPAHVEGFNKESIGITYVGGVDKSTFRPKDTRTEAQKKALTLLLKELRKLYPTAQILGHRDFPNVKKACPSFEAKNEYKNI
ncbi:N-acetylmuramoyl-L-alanine amidase [Capnocytophaga stomatis]|uniref:N-acetylmuramoyl-L-alanine amidase n=1 Tax=Capnocytophaga stomatis TaxID=1848904 RepID=UPI001AD43D18|nr:N-acetylmuramoyl-L-alanine amidase [Capnocytophaga stomatis]GIM49402.1 N-acetylmuramoyl-L-alanine amidase [Capnocytophaga stomatis]